MNYNFVVFGTKEEYYKLSYSSLNSCYENTCYLSEPFEGGGFINKMRSFIRRIHMSPKVNKLIRIPGKSLWNSLLFKDNFFIKKPICFVFFSAGYFNDHIPYGFLDYLKNKYPNSKYVVFYQDLVNANNRRISIDEYKKNMDLVISFDFSDCKKYGLIYHPLVYSDIAKEIEPLKEESDIYFCGAAKNRLKDILDAYDFFNSMGYKCDFHIVTTDRKKIEICYKHDGSPVCSKLPYKENLRHIASCKYLLEIMQKSGTGYTIRGCEAVAFNKKLISNNKFLQSAVFYNVNDIVIFNDIKQLVIKEDVEQSPCILHQSIDKISPYEFVNFIEKNLNGL